MLQQVAKLHVGCMLPGCLIKLMLRMHEAAICESIEAYQHELKLCKASTDAYGMCHSWTCLRGNEA